MDTNTKMRIVIAGGNGFLGHALINQLPFPQAEFVVLTRKAGEQVKGAKVVQWDGETPGDWMNALDGADVLINLSGRSVDCRYTPQNKQAIYDSRVKSTTVLGEAIRKAKQAPALWINAGSATWFRDSYDKDMDEQTGEMGEGFSVDVCRRWEQAFDQAAVPGTRKIVLRISMILGHEAGVLPVLLNLAKKGLGGTQGSGRQYMSWLHEQDFCGIVESCIKNDSWSGVFNCTAPNPLPNKTFMSLVRKAVHAPFGLPAAAWMLEIGAFFMQTETELILKSRRVVPGRLLSEGYRFKFSTAQEAIADLTKTR
jgi:uncharacterized protein (TIGR01777 family)